MRTYKETNKKDIQKSYYRIMTFDRNPLHKYNILDLFFFSLPQTIETKFIVCPTQTSIFIRIVKILFSLSQYTFTIPVRVHSRFMCACIHVNYMQTRYDKNITLLRKCYNNESIDFY